MFMYSCNILVILVIYICIYVYMPVFIFLLDNNTSPLQLRLTGDSIERQGILEILYYGVWGYVCSQGFTLNSANVACRRLGFPGAVSVVSRLMYINSLSSTTPLWLSEIRCFGNETGLEQCPHLGFGNRDNVCEQYNDVGVLCIGMYVHIYVFFIDESMQLFSMKK